MPDNENTITTIFQADISQFSSSTQQLNQYIRTINSEFANATAGMGKWSDSTDGLQAKITQLNGTLDAERKKLANLESQYKALQSSGEGNSYQARQLAIQINNQKAVIGKTEKQVDDYTKSLKELTDAGVKTRQELDDLNKKVKDNGEASESTAKKIMGGLGKGLLGIAGATAGAATGFLALGESTREFRKEQAQLETAFATAGHSADTMKKTYAEFNAVLGDTSKTTEAMQQLAHFTKSEQELTDYTNVLVGAYSKWGSALSTESMAEGINHTIQLGEVQGALADGLEWAGVSVDDFNKKLANCTTEEERSALVLEQLNELYGEEAKHYKENNKDIIEAEKAQTRLTQAMATLGAVAEPIMTMLKNALAGLLEAIQPFVEMIGQGLQGAFSGSSEGAKLFAEGLSGLLNSILEKANELFPKLIDLILQFIPSLIETIVSNLPSIIQTIIDCVVQVSNALSEMLPTLIPIIIDAILMIVDTILGNLDQLIDSGIKLILALIDGINEAIPRLVDKIPEIISKLIRAIVGNFPKFLSAGIQIIVKLAAGLVQAIPQLVEKIPEIILAIVQGIMDGIGDIEEVGADLIKGLWNGIKNTGKWLWEKIKGFGQDIVDRFKKIFKINSPSKVFEDEIGKNLALGIGEGFDDEIGAVTKDMQDSLKGLNAQVGIDAKGIDTINSLKMPNQNMFGELVDLIKSLNKGNVINNYNFDYNFEKMETSKLALHKAVLETKRAIGG